MTLIKHDSEPGARLPQSFAQMDVKDLLEPSPSPSCQPPGQGPSTQENASGRAPSSSQVSYYGLSISLPSVSDYHTVLASPSATYNHVQGSYCERCPQPSPVSPPQQEYQRSWQQDSRRMARAHNKEYQAAQKSQQINALASARSPQKRSSPPDERAPGPPQKRLSKWSPAEDARIIELRGLGMKWSDISKRFPGRSEIACRLHYQNYLEKRGEWDEEKKNKLARVYERLKSELWLPIANELGIPWRAAEAMHWILGEQEMARRANVVPFSLTSAGSAGAGHGRIAQSIRRQDCTVQFEANDLANLYTAVGPGGGPEGRPISTFGYRHGEGGEEILRAKKAKGDGVEGGALPGLLDMERGVSPYAYGGSCGRRGSRNSDSSSEEEGRAKYTSW